MRKVRHLESCEYISPIGQKTGQLISLSNHYQSTVERTTRNGLRGEVTLKIHARLNKGTFDSVKLIAGFYKKGRVLPGIVTEFKVYAVDNVWGESLIGTFPAVPSGERFVADVVQSNFLPADELSGVETYAIEAVGYRRTKTFKEKTYFNDLWIF